jgi:hypothetical protein
MGLMIPGFDKYRSYFVNAFIVRLKSFLFASLLGTRLQAASVLRSIGLTRPKLLGTFEIGCHCIVY